MAAYEVVFYLRSEDVVILIISLLCKMEYVESFTHSRKSNSRSDTHLISLPYGGGPSLTLYHHCFFVFLKCLQQIHSRLRDG